MKKAFLFILVGYVGIIITTHSKAQSLQNPNPVYQAPTGNSSVVVATCGTAPANFPSTSGQRAPDTVDVNGNKCGSTSIASLPSITYNANGIPTLTNGQTISDVQITNSGGVITAVQATSDGLVAVTSVSTSGLGAALWAVSANPANLYGFNIGQSSSSACFLQLFDKTTGNVSLGSTAADQWFMIPGATGGAGNSVPPIIPIRHYFTAITAALTTTATGSTVCGSLGAGSVFIK